jgi:hypothetical protein
VFVCVTSHTQHQSRDRQVICYPLARYAFPTIKHFFSLNLLFIDTVRALEPRKRTFSTLRPAAVLASSSSSSK